MLVFGGLPLFYMELCLGQFHRWFLKQNNDQFSFKGILRTWERKLENLRTSELENNLVFFQMWLSLSLEEDLSSFKRGLPLFQFKIKIIRSTFPSKYKSIFSFQRLVTPSVWLTSTWGCSTTPSSAGPSTTSSQGDGLSDQQCMGIF